ncbi:peptide N-acetyl-beta-D-glucosaminyl asparaginase amidase A-domain-containing protein [Lipomyces starkeyi]
MWLQVPTRNHDDESKKIIGDGNIEDNARLEVFQVYKSANAYGAPVFVRTIMEHTFAFSYGRPFVGTYNPAPVNFTHVQFTLSTTSEGRQFDRLALVFIGDHEVWRTSTAEPTLGGIHFQYTKDMTRFLALLQSEQQIIFEMGNLVDETYTGKFAMTLTAQFYFAPEHVENGSFADTIIPVSARRSSQLKPSHFSLPQDRAAVTLTLPRKVHRVTMLISASGNAAEEFWYTNVASEFKNAFPDVSLDGYGPHRELQVYVNGKLVAATFPFPIIFTGGIAPGLWRPIVGIAAYDLPVYEIDLTAALPLFWEGAEVEVKVESGDVIHNAIGRDWIVSGNIFAWTGDAEGQGEIVEYAVEPLDITTTGALSSDGTQLNVSSVATRNGLVRSVLRFGDNEQQGESRQEHFSQFHIKSRNAQTYTESGRRQRVLAEISGMERSTLLGDHEFSYPLEVDSFYEFSPVFKISAEVSHGMIVDRKKSRFSLWTHQAGHSYYIGPDEHGNGPYGGGATEQGYIESTGVDQYWRTVRAVNGRVVRDLEVYDGLLQDVIDQQVNETEAEEIDVLMQGNKVEAARENLMFVDCLQDYNERVFASTEYINPQDDVEVKKCIKRMLGRGPAL